MRSWKPIAGLILLTSFLLSACGPLTPLLTEKEVLSRLSERYDGAEFVILETINNCEYKTQDKTLRCRLYLAAPAEDQERAFWVHSTVTKSWGGDSLPMRYSSGITDTYAFDYFLERFDTLLTENEIDHFFTMSSGDIAEHLKSPHLQGGGFGIPITQETAEDIVTTVLEIREQLAGEYPLSCYLNYFSHPAYEPIKFVIRFYDAAHGIPDAESLSEYTSFSPYRKKFDENDNIVYRDTVETILADIDKTIYGIVED